MTNPYLFLAGCARSGTTLLKRMVDAHPRIAIVGIGGLLHRYEERDGVTPDGRVTEGLIRELLRKGRLGRDTVLTGAILKDLEGYLSSGDYPPFADLVSTLFDRLGEERGKPLVGYKNVTTTNKLDMLHALFPEARIVHIVRDGRDVALSVLNWRGAQRLSETLSTWDEDPISTVALWWEWNVRKAREDGAALGELYHELFYERLVEDPERECARISEALGVPYSKAMLNFNQGKQQDAPDLDAKHAWKPPTKGLRDWRTQMSREDLVRFDAVAGDFLEELGYERGVHDLPAGALEHAQRLRVRFEGPAARTPAWP